MLTNVFTKGLKRRGGAVFVKTKLIEKMPFLMYFMHLLVEGERTWLEYLVNILSLHVRVCKESLSCDPFLEFKIYVPVREEDVRPIDEHLASKYQFVGEHFPDRARAARINNIMLQVYAHINDSLPFVVTGWNSAYRDDGYVPTVPENFVSEYVASILGDSVDALNQGMFFCINGFDLISEAVVI